MPPPLGRVEFPGIAQSVEASYTWSHGVTPGSCTITAAPSPGLGLGGTLRFVFDGTVIELIDCRVNLASARLTSSGFVWSIQIIDRRWKWQYGSVFAHWNRRDDGGKIEDGSQRSARQMAVDLLQAMGEPKHDVTAIPTDVFPEKKWVGHNPAVELERLCEEVGCRVVCDPTRQFVTAVRMGQGADLLGIVPGVTMESTLTLDPPERPDSIQLFGGPTRFQAWFDLEAVGLETTGETLPIDDLSYKPAAGWGRGTHGTGFGDVLEQFGEEALKLALKTVFRWYRIKPVGKLIDPINFTITDSRQVLPLDSELVEIVLQNFESAVKAEWKDKPARVRGVYLKSFDQLKNTDPKTPFTSDFRLVNETGVIEFTNPVVQFNGSFGAPGFQEATLEAAVAFRLHRALGNGNYHRYFRERDLPGQQFGTGPFVLDRSEEIVAGYYEDTNGVWHDQEEITAQNRDAVADAFIDAAEQRFATFPAAEEKYAGLIFLSLDGAIQQVTWTVGPSGATTSASRNTETHRREPVFRRRTREIRTQDAQKRQEAVDRAAQLPRENNKVRVMQRT